MNLVNYLQFLEPVQEHVTRVYSTASEIITVLLVLWCINFIVGMIQKTYATGQAFGHFYRNYLHGFLQKLTTQLFSFRKDKQTDQGSANSTHRQARQAT